MPEGKAQGRYHDQSLQRCTPLRTAVVAWRVQHPLAVRLPNAPMASHINEKGLSPDKPFVVNALELDHQKPRHDQPCNGHHAEDKQYPAGAGGFTVFDQLLGLQL